MDRLIQMGKDIVYEGEKLQDFVKQQQDYERGGRIAERETERDRIAAQEKERVDKLAERADKLATQGKDIEIELARIAVQEKEKEIELARIAAKKLRQIRIGNLKGIESRRKKRRLRQMKD